VTIFFIQKKNGWVGDGPALLELQRVGTDVVLPAYAGLLLHRGTHLGFKVINCTSLFCCYMWTDIL